MTFEEYIQALNAVLKRLRLCNLTAKPTKCVIAHNTVEFLGHIVSQGKTSPKPEKLAAIQEAPKPKTYSQL